MNSQLKSRLGCGLITEIKAPDFQTKMSIIKRKIKEDHLGLPEDIIFFIAKSNSDIKTLTKNLTRLETYLSLNDGSLNISTVKSIIKESNGSAIEDIQSLTAGYFNITISELISDKKKRAYSYPRHIAMYLCRKYTDLSYEEIGRSFGKKDHSTVIYAIGRIEKLKKEKKDVRDALKKIADLFR
jgi:chromosomal replication initiator protein